jgi:hypothetical protein
MASWRVRITHDDATSTDIDLIDTAGPLNEWKALDPDALLPPSGDFTNQTQNVVPTVQPSWILKNFDIDAVYVGVTDGTGVVEDDDGAFPEGKVTWKVIARL